MRKLKVFVCSRYMGFTGKDDEIQTNLRLAKYIAHQIFKAGGLPVVPHRIMHDLADERDGFYTREEGLQFSRELAAWCDVAVVINGEPSNGMRSDLDVIRALRMPYFVLSGDPNRWYEEINEFFLTYYMGLPYVGE